MLTAEDDHQPIRALNDLLFCERRCAMHRLEQVWVENQFTFDGSASHARAHESDVSDAPPGVKISRGMWLRSDRLRLVGKADIVEFHPEPIPVEYKRGKRRKWDNDDVQLCAQALCLEEMLGVSVPRGAIFHVRSKRRRVVVFDSSLRDKTEASVQRLHELFALGMTPPPVLKPRCRGCSLRDSCMPELLMDPGRAARSAASMCKPVSKAFEFE